MTDEEKWNLALWIVIKDLEEPNEKTRKSAIDADVFEEFFEIRQQLIETAHRKHAMQGSLSKES